MAHAVQPDSFIEISNFYTVTIYEKGAEVVGMIKRIVGDEGFRRGSDLYFERHDGQAVTINEFVGAMEQANNVSLAQFKRWYKQPGTPAVCVSSDYDAESQCYSLHFKQTSPATSGEADKAPLLIPIELGLLDAAGDDMTLTLSNAGQDVRFEDGVFLLDQVERTLVFENIEAKPVPSLLRDFSAPIKLSYDYSRDELLFLMTHDSDGFNRWDAGQNLALDIIYEIMRDQEAGKAPLLDSRLVQAYRTLLSNGSLDPAMLAKMLVLPSVSYIAETHVVIDVHAIYDARQWLQLALSDALSTEMLARYQALLIRQDYRPEPGQMSLRSLKNTLLSFLLKSDKAVALSLAQDQFDNNDNMTDSMAALSALVNSNHQVEADAALEQFYQDWKDEPLVVNQWLSVQAASDNRGQVKHIKALLKHPAFDIKNPNKVRSVLGAFCSQSLINFHAENGEGYRLLADYILLLDELNPQVASRLVAPLSKWQRYVPHLGLQMKAELDRLLQHEKLSKDVYEVVSKSVMNNS